MKQSPSKSTSKELRSWMSPESKSNTETKGDVTSSAGAPSAAQPASASLVAIAATIERPRER